MRNEMKVQKLAVVFCLAIANGAFADTTWTDAGADNLWTNAANWDAGVPISNDYVLVDDGGAGALINDGYYALTELVDVGLDNFGAITIDGGLLDAPPGIRIGDNPGSTGIITVEADGSVAGGWRALQAWYIRLGELGGNGTLVNNGAMIKVWSEWFNIAAWETGTAHVQLNGGFIWADGIHIGSGGTIDLAGGTLVVLGNQLGGLSLLVDSGQLTSYGVAFTVATVTEGFIFDFDVTNPGYTTIKALRSPTDQYLDWAAVYGLTDTNTTAALTYDFEPDGMDNLLEYALGGNPTNSDKAAVYPTSGMVDISGTNYMGFVYNRRLDAASRNLSYDIVTTENLQTAWTTNGGPYETSSSTNNAFFESVTNAIPTDTEKTFIKLEVTENF